MWKKSHRDNNHILCVHRGKHINRIIQRQRQPRICSVLGYYWWRSSDVKWWHQLLSSLGKVPSNQGKRPQSSGWPTTYREWAQIQKQHGEYFHRGILSMTSDLHVALIWLWGPLANLRDGQLRKKAFHKNENHMIDQSKGQESDYL